MSINIDQETRFLLFTYLLVFLELRQCISCLPAALSAYCSRFFETILGFLIALLVLDIGLVSPGSISSASSSSPAK